MRLFPYAPRVAAVALVLSVLSIPAAHADDPTVGELQVRLVESRQQLTTLYAQSAAAAERLHGAQDALEAAGARVKETRASLEQAHGQLEEQRRVVADLTVQQLQSGTSVSNIAAVLDSNGPQQMLERASAYSSTNEAMAARVDQLSARTIVHDVALREAEEAQAAQQAAADQRDQAKAEIDQAIAAVEQAVASTEQERSTLLAQLASAEGTTLAVVTQRQDEIDRRLDEAPVVSTPGPPPAPSEPSNPAPDPAPTQPDPTQPPPTQPDPTQPPPPPPPSNPPPPSTSKVEKAIAFAQSKLGDPYVWGGAGPSSWDCSGLTMRAYQAAGVSMSRSASAQYSQHTKVAVSAIKRGDLLFWSDGSAASIYHTAIYLGDGKMIHAPRPGRSVEIVSLSYWIMPDLASRPG